MVKVKSTLTFDLENGQRITVDQKEVRQLAKILSKIVSKENVAVNGEKAPRKKSGRRKNAPKDNVSKHRMKIPSMSEAKKQEILRNINGHLSSEPTNSFRSSKGYFSFSKSSSIH
jgi:hypothetical protein